MSRHFPRLPIIILTLLVAIPAACAAQTAATDPREGDIRKTIASLEENFNRGDAKGVAACWMPDGEFVGPRGDRIVGRDMIEGAFREYLTTHRNAKLRLGVDSLRLLANDVALVELMTEMIPLPEGLDSEPASAMVLVKRDGHWLIGSMRESVSGAPSHHIHLKNLQWLVGDWASESSGEPGIVAQSTCDWTAGGNYLIRKFTTQRQKGVVLTGTEIIGWDARAHRIRSWTFDSDGSFGEGVWKLDGQQWTIQHTGILADGGDISATFVVTPTGPDTMTVQAKDRLVNGSKQPDFPEFTLKRQRVSEETKTKPNEPVKPPARVLPKAG